MLKSGLTKQLVLNLRLHDDATFANFYPGTNQKIKQVLESLNVKSQNDFIYLWGKSGTGRSHLAIATCQQLGNLGISTAYLPLKDLSMQSPAVLENLEKMFLVCVDDLEAILGQKEWEEALMYLFNRLQTNGGNFLIIAKEAPNALNFILQDLKSRLTSCLIFNLMPLTDEEKLAALTLRAKHRSLKLTRETALFLLRHEQRDFKTLVTILDKLSQAALHSQRALTIPFVKETLGM